MAQHVLAILVILIWGALATAAEPMDTAMTLLRQGKSVDAERLMLDYAEKAKADVGDQHPRYADALFQLSTIRIGIRDFDGGIETLRMAASIPGTDAQSRRDRITYEWNLGQILALAKRLDEAETVLRANLAKRQAFYGREHAGYAFGLLNLIDVLWMNRKSKEALPLAEEALANLRRNRQAERWDACVQLGMLRCDLEEKPTSPFRELAPASEQELAIAVARMSTLVGNRPPDEVIPMALAFRDHLVTAHPSCAASVDQALRIVVSLAITANRHDLRTTTLQQLIDHHPQPDATSVELHLGLANALDAQKDREQALTWYVKACTIAKTVGGACYPNALRNAGLAYRDTGHPERGIDLLRQAIAMARAIKDAEQIGRACIALGVTLQHAKQTEEGRTLLAEGVELLPLMDADMLCGYSHLRSIELRLENCCGESMTFAIQRALKDFINRNVAKGLVESVDGDMTSFAVKTNRAPTPEEQALLDRILAHARAVALKPR